MEQPDDSKDHAKRPQGLYLPASGLTIGRTGDFIPPSTPSIPPSTPHNTFAKLVAQLNTAARSAATAATNPDEPQPEPQARAQIQALVQAQAQAEPKPRSQPQSQSQPQMQPKMQPQTQTQTQPQLKPSQQRPPPPNRASNPPAPQTPPVLSGVFDPPRDHPHNDPNIYVFPIVNHNAVLTELNRLLPASQAYENTAMLDNTPQAMTALRRHPSLPMMPQCEVLYIPRCERMLRSTCQALAILLHFPGGTYIGDVRKWDGMGGRGVAEAIAGLYQVKSLAKGKKIAPWMPEFSGYMEGVKGRLMWMVE